MENLIIMVLQLSILVLVITIAQMVYRISKRTSKNLKEEVTINLYEFSNLAREYFGDTYIYSSVQNSGISIQHEGTIIFVLKFFVKEEICEFRELSSIFKTKREYPEFEQMFNELKKELREKIKEKMPHYKISYVNCLY